MHILLAVIFFLAIAHSVMMVLRLVIYTAGRVASGPPTMKVDRWAIVNGLLWAIFYYCSSY